MVDPVSPPAEVHVREHPMPGNRQMYSIGLSDGTLVTIAADPDRSARQLSVTCAGHDDAALTVSFTEAEATTVAALLSGVRFIVRTAADQQPVGAANLRTVTLGAGSPAVGRRLDEIPVPAPADAMAIAVIRDDTPELIEEDPSRPCQPGDRLVLVGRPGAMADLVQHLLG